MRHPFFGLFAFFLLLSFTACQNALTPDPRPLFDGKTFEGWEGDTLGTWRIEDGAIVGGSLEQTVPNNDFLVTEREYGDFILTLKIKLTGTEGFVNSGIQFHSQRLSAPAYEMEGYQADWGGGYWASLYDESRRNKTLAAPDSAQVLTWIHRDDWNDYKIHAEKRRIRLYINGQKTVDYTEADANIPQRGRIGIQIHGGGKAVVEVKDLMIQELP